MVVEEVLRLLLENSYFDLDSSLIGASTSVVPCSFGFLARKMLALVVQSCKYMMVVTVLANIPLAGMEEHRLLSFLNCSRFAQLGSNRHLEDPREESGHCWLLLALVVMSLMGRMLGICAFEIGDLAEEAGRWEDSKLQTGEL